MSDRDPEKYRLNRYKGDRRKALRDMIKAEKLLADLELIRRDCMQNAETISTNKGCAYKIAVDIAKTQLAKVLPDVKAIEYDPGEKTLELMSRDAINERLAQLFSRRLQIPDGRRGEGSAGVAGTPPATH